MISVTQVLTLAGRIDKTWFSPEAAARGQAVHSLTEAMDRGESLNVPEGLWGYVEAYQMFLAIVRPTYEATELEVQADCLAGRIDRVCSNLFGTRAILDFKTGGRSAWHGQQLAAYNALHPTGARWACYLGANGKYGLQLYEDPADHRRFEYDRASAIDMVTNDGDYWIPRTHGGDDEDGRPRPSIT